MVKFTDGKLHWERDLMPEQQERRKPNYRIEISLAALTIAVGFLGSIGNNWLSAQDKKFDVLFEKLNANLEKENKDFQCLGQNVAKCCKDSNSCS